MDDKKFNKWVSVILKKLENNEIDIQDAEFLVKQIRIMRRVEDPFEWCSYYLPNIFNLPFSKELHGYFWEIAEVERTATLAPRGHGKTMTKCVAIPMYLALNHPQKFTHFLNVQDTSTKAKAINAAIRNEFALNDRLIKDYGDMLSKEKLTERQFVLKNGVVFTAVGSGESVRGINYAGKRPDYIIGDDLYDESCLENIENVRRVNRWWKSSINYCCAVGKKVCIHIQGTAISREDLIHEKEKNSRYVFKRFKAVKDWDTGEVLWPEHKTIDDLIADKVDDGSIIFNREKQNEIRSDDNSIIKLSDIKTYDGRKIMTKTEALHLQSVEKLSELPEHIVCTVAGIDVAEKTKEINDYTARVSLHCTNLNNFYIFDAIQYKKTFNDSLNDIENHFRRNRADRVWIETNKGEALYSELIRRGVVPVYGKHETKDKLSRLVDQQAKFENGKVFISMLIPDQMRNELIDQIVTNKPPHDDLRDACLLAMEAAGMASSRVVF